MMRIDVITLFPGVFPGPLAESIPGRALERGLAELHAHDLREWGLGRHRSVDDYPYGGGAGMVLRPEPVAAALDALAPPGSAAFRILLDPGGEPFRRPARGRPRGAPAPRLRLPALRGHRRARPQPRGPRALGRRLRRCRAARSRRWSSSTPSCACCPVPSTRPRRSRSRSRTACSSTRSTRAPRCSATMAVPEILISGHHGAVAAWRHEQAIERTRRHRPDLLASADAQPGAAPAAGDGPDA